MKYYVGNKTAVGYLEQAVKNDNLTHAYLFCGPEGVGKTKAGEYFAKLLLCESENPLACEGCPSCKLFESGNHPDFFCYDKGAILVDEMRDLISSLGLSSYRGRGKAVVLPHAERYTVQALNSLLKTLEEPNPETTIILTTEKKNNLLPTIVSRARTVNFGLSDDKSIFEMLNGEMGIKKEEATSIVKISTGRPGVAASLAADPDKVQEIIKLVNSFIMVYRSADVYEKIMFAEVLAKDKETLSDKLQLFESAARGELLASYERGINGKTTETVLLIDQLAKAKRMLAGNGNAKLILESVLLGSI